MVDLEFSLRNLASVEQQGGDFYMAMIDRANRIRRKIELILDAVDLSELAIVFAELPKTIDATTSISREWPTKVSQATKQFVQRYDGTTLDELDRLIPP